MSKASASRCGFGRTKSTSQPIATTTIVAMAVTTTVQSQRRWIPRTAAPPSRPVMTPIALSLTPSANARRQPGRDAPPTRSVRPAAQQQDRRDGEGERDHRFQHRQAAVEHRERRAHRGRPGEHGPDGPERATEPEPDDQPDADRRGHRDQASLDEADAKDGEHRGFDDREGELQDVEGPLVDVQASELDQVPRAQDAVPLIEKAAFEPLRPVVGSRSRPASSTTPMTMGTAAISNHGRRRAAVPRRPATSGSEAVNEAIATGSVPGSVAAGRVDGLPVLVDDLLGDVRRHVLVVVERRRERAATLRPASAARSRTRTAPPAARAR